MKTMHAADAAASARLEPLFDVEWRIEPDAPTVAGPEDRDGAHIGNGTGVVYGPAVDGRVRFSFYTAECPYDPGFMESSGLTWDDLGDHVCRIDPAGVIETADGATIQFEVRGFGLRLERRAPLWSLTGAVRLVSADERYRWLNDLAAVWEGEFDEATGTARYRVHARVPAGEAASR